MTDGAQAPDGAGPRTGAAPGEEAAHRNAAGDFPAEAVGVLRCPVCGDGFTPEGRSLRCPNAHSYDVARHGYVNLLTGGARPGTADTAAMVAARQAFLRAGHYAGLRDFICEAAVRAIGGGARAVGAGLAGGGSGAATEVGAGGRAPRGAHADEGGPGGGCLVEVGAGTGYYLAGVLDRFPRHMGLALDISKFAARRAARAHERMAAIVCDTWSRLPVAGGCAALVLDIFAPRNPPEFRRVLRPDGALLVVTPSPRHLQELVAGLGLLKVDERKPERLESSLGGDFELLGQIEFEETLRLTPAEAGALAAMGPSAHHMRADALAERLAPLGDAVEITLSVRASTYRPR